MWVKMFVSVCRVFIAERDGSRSWIAQDGDRKNAREDRLEIRFLLYFTQMRSKYTSPLEIDFVSRTTVSKRWNSQERRFMVHLM